MGHHHHSGQPEPLSNCCYCKNFFLISSLNLPSFSLKPFPLVPSLQSLLRVCPLLSYSPPLDTDRLLSGLPGAFSSPGCTAYVLVADSLWSLKLQYYVLPPSDLGGWNGLGGAVGCGQRWRFVADYSVWRCAALLQDSTLCTWLSICKGKLELA